LDSVTWLDEKRHLTLNQTLQLMAKEVCQSFKSYLSIIHCIHLHLRDCATFSTSQHNVTHAKFSVHPLAALRHRIWRGGYGTLQFPGPYPKHKSSRRNSKSLLEIAQRSINEDLLLTWSCKRSLASEYQ